MKLFFSLISLTLTSFALAFGVFSVTMAPFAINGTVNYVATSGLIQIVSSITNGFQDDDNDGSLIDINPTRTITVKNFDDNYFTSDFYVSDGINTGRFLMGARWDIGEMYFDPSETPDSEHPSTITISFAISNYSQFPVSATIASSGNIDWPYYDNETLIVDYAISDTSTPISAGSTSTPSTATYTITFNLYETYEIGALDFNFTLSVTPV